MAVLTCRPPVSHAFTDSFAVASLSHVMSHTHRIAPHEIPTNIFHFIPLPRMSCNESYDYRATNVISCTNDNLLRRNIARQEPYPSSHHTSLAPSQSNFQKRRRGRACQNWSPLDVQQVHLTFLQSPMYCRPCLPTLFCVCVQHTLEECL